MLRLRHTTDFLSKEVYLFISLLYPSVTWKVVWTSCKMLGNKFTYTRWEFETVQLLPMTPVCMIWVRKWHKILACINTRKIAVESAKKVCGASDTTRLVYSRFQHVNFVFYTASLFVTRLSSLNEISDQQMPKTCITRRLAHAPSSNRQVHKQPVLNNLKSWKRGTRLSKYFWAFCNGVSGHNCWSKCFRNTKVQQYLQSLQKFVRTVKNHQLFTIIFPKNPLLVIVQHPHPHLNVETRI